MTLISSLKMFLKPMIIPIMFLVIASLSIRGFLPSDKSKVNLLIVAAVLGSLILVSFIIQYFLSFTWKQQFSKLLKLKAE